MPRMRVDVDTASAVADALSYYLMASSENFGSGFDGEDYETVAAFQNERRLIEQFQHRLEEVTG
jgi:hypothetical protein